MFYKMIDNACRSWYQSDDCTVKDLISYIETTGQMRDAQIEAIKTYQSGKQFPLGKNAYIKISKYNFSIKKAKA